METIILELGIYVGNIAIMGWLEPRPPPAAGGCAEARGDREVGRAQ